MTTRVEKQRITDRILHNSVFLPLSGARKRLESALLRMSVSDLQVLDLIVTQKVIDAKELTEGVHKLLQKKIG